jgi:hypothetical protein
MIVKVVVPDSIYARVYFARGEQGPQGIPGVPGADSNVPGPAGPAGRDGTNGTNGTNGIDGVGYAGITSTTSVPVTAGLHTWTVANVGAFLPGMRIRAIHTDTPTIWLEGFANVASGTTIIITADKVSGSGTHNTWKFAVAGEVGQAGTNGTNGIDGTNGTNGINGTNGTNGLDGLGFGPINYLSNRYYTTPHQSKGASTPTIGQTNLHAFVATKTQTFTKLGIFLTGTNANGVATLGVYDSNSDGFPNNRLAQGTITTETTGFQQVTGLTINMTKGSLYWLAINFQGVTSLAGLTVGVSSNTGYGNAFITTSAPTSSTFTPQAYFATSQTGLPSTWTSTGLAASATILWIGY